MPPAGRSMVNFRHEYAPIISAVQAAGFFVTENPLDSGDRIVCCGMRREAGGYTGNSFWFAERDGRWFLGAWGGKLYRVPDANTASIIATAWLAQNYTETVADVPDEIKSQFQLVEADDSEFGPV